jgi:O-antigen/teichoic acid export membrane protein
MLPCVSKNIIAKLLTLVGVFLLVKNESHVGRYIALVAISMLITNICVYVQLRGVVLRPQIHWRNLIDHLKGSAFLFLPQIASILYLQMGKVMMGSMTGRTDQVSFYDQAEKIVTVALSCITVLSTVMMPRIANEYKKNNIETVTYYLNKGAKYSMAIAAPMMVGLWCTAVYLIPWYLGKDYMPTAYAIMIIAPIVVFNSLMGISGRQYFVATNKIIPLTMANIIAAISNILLNTILIPRWGYKGSAVATVVSSSLNVVFQFYWMNKTISVRHIMKGSCRYLFYAIVMGGITVLATFLMKLYASVWTTIIQMIVAIFAYSFILYIIKDEIFLTGRKIVFDCVNKFVLKIHKHC